MEQRRFPSNVLLVDTNNLVMRAFYSNPTNAADYALRHIRELAQFLNSSYIVACFDAKDGSAYRREKYAGYKSNRKTKPEGVRVQLRKIYRSLEYVAAREAHPGYEADDIIASLIDRMDEDGILDTHRRAVIVSNDRDFWALLKKDRVHQADLRDGTVRVMSEEKAKEELGFDLKHYLDYKILAGDSSDNVPGVPGVGPKTAARWIREFGGLDSILKHVDVLPGPVKCRAALKSVADSGQLQTFREILSFRRDCPVVWRWPAIDAILD